MPHYRQTIREAVAAVLYGETEAGENVFTSRARPILEILQKREMVLSVYTAEEISKRNGDSYILDRILTVSIEGVAGGGDDVDDILDSLSAEVEALIDADPMLGNLLSNEMVLMSTTSEITSRGNQQVGAFKMDYECGYKTERQRAGYLPGDAPDDEIPDPPVPGEVTTNPVPTPIAYVNDPLALDIGGNLLDTDVTLHPSEPAAPSNSVCGEDGCDIPDWVGEQ